MGDYTTASDNTCKMSLYTVLFVDDTHGNVLVIYYLAIWIVIACLALFGFVLLICNCNMLCRRIFAIMLIAAAGCLSFAEVISIMGTDALAEERFTAGDYGYWNVTSLPIPHLMHGQKSKMYIKIVTDLQ